MKLLHSSAFYLRAPCYILATYIFPHDDEQNFILLYCIVLSRVELYCILIYCKYRIVFYCKYCIVLYCLYFVLYYIILYCIVLCLYSIVFLTLEYDIVSGQDIIYFHRSVIVHFALKHTLHLGIQETIFKISSSCHTCPFSFLTFFS